MVGSGGVIKRRIYERYKIIGFISSGTYGRVYKASGRNGEIAEFAIKKYVGSFALKSWI
jgi:cyclin-dependent kinase 8/11